MLLGNPSCGDERLEGSDLIFSSAAGDSVSYRPLSVSEDIVRLQASFAEDARTKQYISDTSFLKANLAAMCAPKEPVTPVSSCNLCKWLQLALRY